MIIIHEVHCQGNRRILYEFSNRGNRGFMGFNYGRVTVGLAYSTHAVVI